MAGTCTVCREAIAEDVIFAGDLTMHGDCFAYVRS